MYNWITDLESIYKKLEDEGQFKIKNEMFQSQLSGGTGWEIFLLICEILKDIRSNHPVIYDIIKKEADRVLSYGYENGFLKKG